MRGCCARGRGKNSEGGRIYGVAVRGEDPSRCMVGWGKVDWDLSGAKRGLVVRANRGRPLDKRHDHRPSKRW